MNCMSRVSRRAGDLKLKPHKAISMFQVSKGLFVVVAKTKLARCRSCDLAVDGIKLRYAISQAACERELFGSMM